MTEGKANDSCFHTSTGNFVPPDPLNSSRQSKKKTSVWPIHETSSVASNCFEMPTLQHARAMCLIGQFSGSVGLGLSSCTFCFNSALMHTKQNISSTAVHSRRHAMETTELFFAVGKCSRQNDHHRNTSWQQLPDCSSPEP